jgi:dTDP-glucose 4,6-dehydratase
MRKKLLLTGGAGFIGHHVLDHFLQHTDWDIITLDRLDYSGNLKRIQDVVSNYTPTEQKRVKTLWHDLKAEVSDLTSNFISDVNIILHLAASSHVDRSITHPMEFVMDNTIGTVNLLNYARRLKNLERFVYFSTDEIFGSAPPGVLYGEYDRYNSTNPYSASKAAAEEFCVAYENTYNLPIYVTHCHDENTRAWTEHGFKNVEELSLGDNVWVLKDNKELTLEPILEIVHSDYVGDMIEFRSTKYDLCVTPNHRMLTRYRNETEYRIETADTIFNDNVRHHVPLTGRWEGVDADVLNLSQHSNCFNEMHYNATKVNYQNIETDTFMAFLGWYLSEGFTRTDLTGGVSIAQKKHDITNLMESVGDQFGLNLFKKERLDGVVAYSFNSTALSRYMNEQFGSSSHNKKIPSWIKSMSKNKLRILFEALMMGDGSNTDSYMRYYTVSYNFAVDVAEIGVKLGYSVSIQSRETLNPTKTKEATSFYVSFRQPVGGIDNRNKSRKHYNGKIWCVRTNSGNFFIERNGIVSCSGNTMNVFGERQHPEKFIPMCIRKIRDGEKIYVHADPTKTQAGSRFYIYSADVAEALGHLLFEMDSHNQAIVKAHMDSLGVRCPKFNIVGKEEIDNLSMVKILAEAQDKQPVYEMVDFHTSRPGHDLRYSLDGTFMRNLGWEPKVSLKERLHEVSRWSLEHKEWIDL